MAKAPSKFETGMLSFERSLQVSEAMMFGIAGTGLDEKRHPVPVIEKGVLGQNSPDYLTDEAKEKSAAKPSPQTVEAASVPPGCDALEITFSLRVLPGSLRPSSCDNAEVGRAYGDLARVYAAHGGYRVLAERYIWNLLNGRIAWRNAFQTDDATVTLTWGKVAEATFVTRVLDGIGRQHPLALAEIAHLDGISTLDAASVADRLDDLAGRFAGALAGEDDPLTIQVAWRGAMLPGQEVFPSQEYLRDEKKAVAPSRVYAKIMSGGVAQASIHSQKIGAAIRHIDDWHGSSEHGVVAVNPYAGVQATREALRVGKGKASDFYVLRRDADKLAEGIGESIPDDLHFVMANLVRGGVFSKANDEPKGKGKKGGEKKGEGE